MKKYFILGLLIVTMLCGCGKVNKDNIIKDFENNVNSSSSYKLNGTMQLLGDEDTFNYTLEVIYLKDNFYKVTLINQSNNHEQIILRNNDGVYVITPSLNKSFKFDSVWPSNSSQSYLLGSLVNDIKNDQNTEFSEDDNYYIIKSTVNYPNNSDLKYQKIYFNKNKVLQKVEVYDNNDNVKIKVEFTNVDMKNNAKEEDFNLSNFIDEESNTSCTGDTCDKTTSSIENIIYPLYVPSNTYLKGSDTVNNETTQRNILTFAGDKNFALVEESSKPLEEFEVIPVYGDPLLLNDTVAALGTNSINWTSNGMDYYIVSNDLTSEELVSVASSLGTNTAVSASK
jgi:outer membrane lipoprotein-sorting protein